MKPRNHDINVSQNDIWEPRVINILCHPSMYLIETACIWYDKGSTVLRAVVNNVLQLCTPEKGVTEG